MEENERKVQYEKNEYLYQIIYLIRINFPSSEYLYIIMFFLKYIGLILFSISLNKWNNDKNNSTKTISSSDRIQGFFSKFLINGNNLKILIKNYEQICIFGFCILIFYTTCVIFGIIYMKNKFGHRKGISAIAKALKNINKNSIFEEKYFKILSYILFLIAFTHQYILEYYYFGFIGYILESFDVFESNLFKDENLEYSRYVEEHLKHKSFNHIFMIIINLISIILVLIFFLFFMILNSSKTLFLNNGLPFYGNKRYLFIKIIFCNLNPFYGLVNSLNNEIKVKCSLIIIIIIFILNFINLLISFKKFCCYPGKLNYICLFIEFFLLFANITEIIFFISKANIFSLQVHIFKIIIELFNSVTFTTLFIYKKEGHSMKEFTNNLFCTTYKKMNPNDVYYYIETYIKYYENKKNNYMKIFSLIQNHILSCEKVDCACRVLISKSILSNFVQNTKIMKTDTFKDNNIKNFNSEKKKESIRNMKFISSSETNLIQIYKEDNKENDNNRIRQRIKKHSSSFSSFSLNYLKDDYNFKSKFKKKKTTELEKDIDKELKIFMSISPTHKKFNLPNRKNKFSDFINLIPVNGTSKEKTKTKIINNNGGNNGNNNNENDSPPLPEKNKKLKEEHFQMIGEQEIINRINYLFKRKKNTQLEYYIFIHLQYLIKVKQNYRLALYFVSKYSLCEIKFSFLSRYFLYEIKRYICKTILNLNNLKIIKDSYIIKYREENIFMKRLISYCTYFNMIKTLLIISCEKIIDFFKFRSGLHNSLTLQKYAKSKIYPIINSAEEMETSISKLEFLIHKIYKEANHKNESIELSYLITNFFKLIEGKVSQNILKNISPILSFKDPDYKKLTNEFHLFLMSNPLIISLSNKDTFIINYFTKIFLYKLGYSYSDLNNMDFHEKLFPGEQEMCKDHSFILKLFLFFYKNSYVKNKTFLKSKDGYLVPINFLCKSFPNYENEFSIIANIVFIDNLIDNNKKGNFKIIGESYINKYSFLLNHEFYILGMTKNFFLEYNLNQNMFKELRINFCRFFSIDENKLVEQIEREIKKIIKKHKNFNLKIPLREAAKVYMIFKNIKNENTFKLRDEKLLEYFLYPTLFLYDKIDKKKLIHTIPEIISIIDEIGLDYDWYVRLQNFKDKLIKNNNFKIKKESNISSERRFSTVILNNSIINRNNYNSETFFEVVYSIKKLGSFTYFIVNLQERINNVFEQTQIGNDFQSLNREEPLNTINKYPLRKINSKKGVKFNKTASIKGIEDLKNEHKDIYFLRKNLKTNNLYYESDYKMEYMDENNKNNNKSNDKKITEDQINRKGLYFNNKENNLNDIKEKIKTDRASSKNDSRNYLKKLKIAKTVSADDENSPLISKDKFKEVLIKIQKYNKILIILVYSLILSTIILICIKVAFCIKGFDDSRNVLTFSIYLEMLKSDIFSESILSLIYCIYEKEPIMGISQIHSEAKFKLENILNHLKTLQDQVKTVLNNRHSIPIFKLVEKSFIIQTLDYDWNITKRKADILNEIRRLSYILYNLTFSNETCNISAFYEYYEKGMEFIKNEQNTAPTDMQKIFFYITSNILSNFQITFENFANQCIITLGNMWISFQKIIVLLLYLILILLIIFLVIYIVKYCLDFFYYKLLFLYYYNIENEHLQFKNKIIYLYKTILEFEPDNISNFENVKNNSGLLVSKKEIKKTSSITKIKKCQSPKNFNKFRIQKRNSVSNKNSFTIVNKLVHEQNSMSGPILNNSNNGSSLQLLNNSDNKLPFNHDIENNNNQNNNPYLNDQNEIEQKKESEEDTLDVLLKIMKKMMPYSLRLSLILTVLNIFIYILLAGFNIVEVYKENKKWNYSTNLLMNILDKIPRLTGTILYACISVLSNNLTIIEISQNDSSNSEYLYYFKANSLYYSEDMMNKYFHNNFFGELLKNNLRINYNLENYLTTNEIFVNTKYWDAHLNKPGYFCIYVVLGGMLSEKSLSLYEFTENMNILSSRCREENEVINESGAKHEINFILQEITNKFIDFITYKSSNITLEEAREKFLYSKEMQYMLLELEFSLSLYFNTIINVINLDFDVLNRSIEDRQNIYSGCLLFMNLIILLLLLVSITRNEKYKKLFGYFIEIPKTNRLN